MSRIDKMISTSRYLQIVVWALICWNGSMLVATTQCCEYSTALTILFRVFLIVSFLGANGMSILAASDLFMVRTLPSSLDPLFVQLPPHFAFVGIGLAASTCVMQLCSWLRAGLKEPLFWKLMLLYLGSNFLTFSIYCLGASSHTRWCNCVCHANVAHSSKLRINADLESNAIDEKQVASSGEPTPIIQQGTDPELEAMLKQIQLRRQNSNAAVESQVLGKVKPSPTEQNPQGVAVSLNSAHSTPYEALKDLMEVRAVREAIYADCGREHVAIVYRASMAEEDGKRGLQVVQLEHYTLRGREEVMGDG